MDQQRAAADLIHRTRVNRGLPATVEDPSALARVAVLIAPETTTPASGSSRERASSRLEKESSHVSPSG